MATKFADIAKAPNSTLSSLCCSIFKVIYVSETNDRSEALCHMQHGWTVWCGVCVVGDGAMECLY
jgi:hypothetical protein